MLWLGLLVTFSVTLLVSFIKYRAEQRAWNAKRDAERADARRRKLDAVEESISTISRREWR